MNSSLIEEKKGFGWLGLGSRQILFDNDRKEYFYQVTEPPLTPKQEQIKNINLFEQFQSNYQEKLGSGIGLYLVSEIIKAFEAVGVKVAQLPEEVADIVAKLM